MFGDQTKAPSRVSAKASSFEACPELDHGISHFSRLKIEQGRAPTPHNSGKPGEILRAGYVVTHTPRSGSRLLLGSGRTCERNFIDLQHAGQRHGTGAWAVAICSRRFPAQPELGIARAASGTGLPVNLHAGEAGGVFVPVPLVVNEGLLRTLHLWLQ